MKMLFSEKVWKWLTSIARVVAVAVPIGWLRLFVKSSAGSLKAS